MIAILGAGKMGEALMSGLLGSGTDPSTVLITEPRDDHAAQISAKYGVEAVPADVAVTRADTVILAVKPQSMSALLREVAPLVRDDQLLVSIAAGISTESVERHLSTAGRKAAVVRAMPNTPALVGQGMTAIAGGTHALEEHLDQARRLLETVGEVVRVAESSMDAVTALSGSGPAYFYLMVESMVDAGVLEGLPRDTAERLVVQTISGAAAMLRESGDDAVVLRRNVTSPAGTTAAALRELERSGFRSAVASAIEAARNRGHQLSRE
ncbi:pyrroline-5-carboxylate reductase [Spiractinospora alimapuensis]|uniref:pyrroline-5-carboxylate reductase n=1 Tax=Spiractinospora alimapuensis TaxID=2820884 RepID=UPI001EEAEFEE|nr:pyrroline-5-carboxylate reductase [Spiractinospora alimapuensis]QVQ50973.1 pyrroline-5-carboxylate reductase [Spiractinospora alimapuensis]